MKTHLSFLRYTFYFLAITLILASQFVYSQIPTTPSKSVEQTKFKVFDKSYKTDPLANFRLILDYKANSESTLSVTDNYLVQLPRGSHQIELLYQQTGSSSVVVNTKIDGEIINQNKIIADPNKPSHSPSKKFLPTGGDFTVSVFFKAISDGTLFSKSSPKGPWSRNSKALFIKDGHLIYDVGWVGAIDGPQINDGKLHHAVIRSHDNIIELALDGEVIGEAELSAPDIKDHFFKIADGASDFTGRFENGTISNLRYWSRSLSGTEYDSLLKGDVDAINTPDLNWFPDSSTETFGGAGISGIPTQLVLTPGEKFSIAEAWVQPLKATSHANLIQSWNKKTLTLGKKIYNTNCITCHGDMKREGSLPTALKFHQGNFKNGIDPYRMYQTLDKGYGMMMPQNQYNAEEKYSVIHYIRETFLKADNSSQYFETDPKYLNSLPVGLNLPKIKKKPSFSKNAKPFELMDFGPSLNWTLQINQPNEEKNIAQKGIVIRLDEGKGGVSKGKSWIVYDHDTMRVATIYSGKFIDWRGIAFDGSHQSHTSIAGNPLFTNPDTPAWEYPSKKSWEDERILGRDGRHYGPLPKNWVHYLGKYRYENKLILHYRVGQTEILELPAIYSDSGDEIITRTMNIAKSSHNLVTRVAPPENNFVVGLKATEGVRLERKKDGVYLHITASDSPINLTLGFASKSVNNIDERLREPANLRPFTKGGLSNYPNEIITNGEQGKDDQAFTYDVITIPNKQDNPWNSWMRLGGFDFFQNNPDRAAVCTWLGDVWLVDGIAGDLKEIRWRRICTGLFQPLGLKIVDNTIYVTCRDQIARLHDLNGDEEIDYIENFNNDHQVTEHFHEFAMGLQTDDKGNFYYAKSARHAKKAVVPHHGTLLKVSPDGLNTEIVATGFRAANGVCLNPDGTWIVTDQEGHWNPKNRINYVKEGGFYGNMYGYHDVTDTSDAAMEQPLTWITNSFDRSPAELLWVPDDAAWGPLNGTLLNLSYGYGKVYTVPHEVINGQAQGGMCALPIDAAPSGLHRGRFHPTNKQLYAVGMFAWAGSQQEDGFFCRIRYTGKPSYLPIKTTAEKNLYSITFSDPIPNNASFKVKIWDLKRTAKYGSSHLNERDLAVSDVKIAGAKAILKIPKLKPTWGMEISCDLGNNTKRIIHASVHKLK